MSCCEKCGQKIDEGMNYCPSCGVNVKKVKREEYTVSSDDLVKKIKEIIHEGNVTRIIVKNERDEILLEIPVTVGFVGVVLAPWLAALGVIAAIATRCKIIVEKRVP
jgi:uncharacterized membrane protein YvbJ